MQNDPLLTVTHFDRRFKSLMKCVIKSDKCPLVTVIDYFGRAEFQNRGSPHYRLSFWVAAV